MRDARLEFSRAFILDWIGKDKFYKYGFYGYCLLSLIYSYSTYLPSYFSTLLICFVDFGAQ